MIYLKKCWVGVKHQSFTSDSVQYLLLSKTACIQQVKDYVRGWISSTVYRFNTGDTEYKGQHVQHVHKAKKKNICVSTNML